MAERVASLYAEIGAKTDGLKAGLASAKAGLTGFAANAKSTLASAGTAWSNLATPINQTIQILGQVGQAAQQAYQFISEGTQLATTERQFGALSNSIGSTADALLGELKTATRGTISDFDLMKSATSIMSLGLADTSEETVRLASLVGKLGWDMNQVTLTLANQSTMRLDSLGLSVSDVTSRVDALKEAGYSADQAFKFAILEAGEAKVQLLGDAADTTAGKLKILEANAANFKDTAQAAFSQELITNINDLAGGLFESAEGASSFGEQFGKAFAGFLTGGQFTAAAAQVDTLNQSTYVLANQSMPALERQLEQERAAMIASMTAIDDRREAIESHSATIADALPLIRAHATAVYRDSDAYAEFQDKLIQSNSQLSENQAMVATANARMVEWGETIPTVTGYIAKSAEAMDAFTASTGQYFMAAAEAGDSLGFFNENLADLGTSLVATTVSIGDNTGDLDLLQDAYDKAAAKVKKYQLGIEGATLSEEERAEKIGELQGLMANYQAQMDSLGGSITTYSQRNVEATVNQDAVNQALVESIAAAGGSAAEIGAAALALGTMSEAQVEAAMKAAELEIRIAGVRQAYLDGRISADDLSTAIAQQIDIVNGMDMTVNTATGDVGLFGESMTNAAATSDTLQEKFNRFNLDAGIGATQAFIDKLNSIPRTVDVQVNVHGGGAGTNYGGGGYQNLDGPDSTVAPGAAAGANYIVPPGYNENWYQPVSSGEHVQVTPAGQQTRGGDTYNVYLTPANPDNVIQSLNYMKALSGA